MKCRKKIFHRIVICISFLLILIFSKNEVEAKNNAITDPQGNIIFYTTDTKATTATVWTEVGFTIRLEETNGNPLKNDKYAILYMKSSYRTKKQNGNSYQVKFTIPKADIVAALEKAGISDEGEEEILYLNGIFRVRRNGVADSKDYWTLSGIKNAAPWRNPSDFEELFDVKVQFEKEKYPVYVEYRTSKNEVIVTEKKGSEKGGKKVSCSFDEDKTYQGEKYSIYRSFYQTISNPDRKLEEKSLGKGDSKNQVKNRTAVVKSGGIKFVAIMKRSGEEGQKEDERVEVLPDEIESHIQIQADVRGNEKFDVLEGIPTMENLYVNGFCREYLTEYFFKKVYGEKSYPVTVKRNYILAWKEEVIKTDKNGKVTTEYKEHSVARQVQQLIVVRREYQYWTIQNLSVYIPQKMLVNNGALPSKTLVVDAVNPYRPVIDAVQYQGVSGHIKEPVYPKTVVLPEVTIYGGTSCPDLPGENFAGYAQEAVDEIKVRNDKLLWNGKTIMRDTYEKKETKEPEKVPVCKKMTEKDVFYQYGLGIETEKKNGVYKSFGNFTYTCAYRVGNVREQKPEYVTDEINPVTVHTPVISCGTLENKYRDCQMLFPDTERCSLILGLDFNIYMPTVGQHKYIKGYEYRDYEKYTKERQVRFPFEVEVGGCLYPADSWITIETNAKAHLPTWIAEGKYQVEFRAVARNGVGMEGYTQEFANEDYENYVAVNTIPVEVSGRLYDFRVYDISDYPLWKSVFRKKESLKKSGFTFPVAKLPLKKGSHPLFSQQGYIKPGYSIRMQLLSSGDMENENDYICILPRFYYVDETYQVREEVDVYYSETIEGKFYPLVQIGSQINEKNLKYLQMDDTYLSIEEDEVLLTAQRKNINLEQLKTVRLPVYNYNRIMIPAALQVLMPQKGIQKWYFEYSLPSKIYVTEKGFPLKEYCREHTLTFRENFWKKKGYLLVNFDIETIQEGKRHLSYINEKMELQGYCNQWKREGFYYENCLSNGDLAFFSLQDSAAGDYHSGGTH